MSWVSRLSAIKRGYMIYRTVKLSGWEIKLSEDFPSAFESVIASGVNLPNGQRAAFEKLASSRFARVLQCNVLFRARVYSLIIKQYFNRNLLDIFKALICTTRAQKAFRAGQMMTQNGFLVPPAVACGKKVLITLEVKDSTPLYQLLGKLPPAEKQKMLEQFGHTVGRMHDIGIFHGDLRLGNVLVKKHGEKFDFIFLDNERTKKFEKLPLRLRIKNLVQVNMLRDNISDSDRTNFLDAYLSQQNIEIDKEKLADEVTARTNKRLAARGVLPKTV
jgi:tRNA A-37 threonylcarbamoyl transferase component Bud32